MKKLLILIAVQLTVVSLINAQAIIIKKDKTEIKAKVLEITEDKIKYNKWEMKDGPVYNISKSEVFMILHQNGQREIINTEEEVVQKPVINKAPATTPATTQNTNSRTISPVQGTTNIDTSLDKQNAKIKYAPTRLTVGLSSPLSLSYDLESRIMKNTLNIGLSGQTVFYNETSSSSYYLYLSGYLPLNRLMNKFEDQDKGLFIYGHAGVAVTSVQVPKISSFGSISYETVWSTGFGWYIGADYFFMKRFGIAVKTNQFKSFSAGVVTSFSKTTKPKK